MHGETKTYLCLKLAITGKELKQLCLQNGWILGETGSWLWSSTWAYLGFFALESASWQSAAGRFSVFTATTEAIQLLKHDWTRSTCPHHWPLQLTISNTSQNSWRRKAATCTHWPSLQESSWNHIILGMTFGWSIYWYNAYTYGWQSTLTDGKICCYSFQITAEDKANASSHWNRTMWRRLSPKLWSQCQTSPTPNNIQ